MPLKAHPLDVVSLEVGLPFTVNKKQLATCANFE
jgi:hypothetical protein